MFPVTVNISSKLGIGTFFKITSVGALVSGVLAAALTFASIAFILYFVWGAFRWLTAGGDKGQLETARQRILNAFIGLVLIAVAWAIYILVIYLLGLEGAINLVGGAGGPGGPGGTPTPGGSYGNSFCVCGGAGGCATTGQIGPRGTADTTCYQCTASGWQNLGYSGCTPISCATCPP